MGSGAVARSRGVDGSELLRLDLPQLVAPWYRTSGSGRGLGESSVLDAWKLRRLARSVFHRLHSPTKRGTQLKAHWRFPADPGWNQAVQILRAWSQRILRVDSDLLWKVPFGERMGFANTLGKQQRDIDKTNQVPGNILFGLLNRTFGQVGIEQTGIASGIASYFVGGSPSIHPSLPWSAKS